jgi:UDP-3-O-[3-hydroxymyristoyl] N-acetylglucosamine deacetylase
VHKEFIASPDIDSLPAAAIRILAETIVDLLPRGTCGEDERQPSAGYSMSRLSGLRSSGLAGFSGIGLHSGAAVAVRVFGASPGTGTVFVRADLPGRPAIPVRWDRTGSLALCTTLRGAGEAEVGTVEHLLAAMSAVGLWDAIVEVDGPEVPILDGSAWPFLAGLQRAGRMAWRCGQRRVRIIRPVEVTDGGKSARFEPHDGFAVSVEIDFPHAAIGRSSFSAEICAGSFGRLLARARTFALLSDVERLRAGGLARGGSLANAVVVGAEGVLNPEGLRFADEFVRHKALDVVGDLALIGAPLLGRYTGSKPGHALTNALLRTLMADRTAWEWVPGAAGREAASHRQVAVAE